MFAEVEVGIPISKEPLTVFPLFAPQLVPVAYQIAEDAMADDTLIVKEFEGGESVIEIVVQNQGSVRVLLIEGEHLIGAKQNRLLNTTVLVPPHTALKVPVSCVEKQRWRGITSQFDLSGSNSSLNLRSVLKRSVGSSLSNGKGHRSDQAEIWHCVDELHSSLGTDSGTSALEDAYLTIVDDQASYLEALPYIDAADGIAIAIAGRLRVVDLFDKQETCRKLWNRLIGGSVLDAIVQNEPINSPVPTDVVQRLFTRFSAAQWKQFAPVGEGSHLRAELVSGECASALILDGALIHGSVVIAA